MVMEKVKALEKAQALAEALAQGVHTGPNTNSENLSGPRPVVANLHIMGQYRGHGQKCTSCKFHCLSFHHAE